MTQTNQNNLTANAVAVESAIGNRQSAIGNRQSAIGNRQSAIPLLCLIFCAALLTSGSQNATAATSIIPVAAQTGINNPLVIPALTGINNHLVIPAKAKINPHEAQTLTRHSRAEGAGIQHSRESAPALAGAKAGIQLRVLPLQLLDNRYRDYVGFPPLLRSGENDGKSFSDFYRASQMELFSVLDNALSQKAEETLTEFAAVKKADVQLQTTLGNRKGQIAANIIGAFVDSQSHAFGWQVRVYGGENDSKGANAGIFFRRVDGESLYGINTFADYEKGDYGEFLRYGIGGELQNRYASFAMNYYLPITDDKHTGSTVAFSQKGYDANLRINIPQLDFLKVAADYYHFDGKYGGENDNGFRYGLEVQPINNLHIGVFYDDGGEKFGGDIVYVYNIAAPQKRESKTAFSPDLFAPVVREYSQRIITATTGPGISLRVRAINTTFITATIAAVITRTTTEMLTTSASRPASVHFTTRIDDPSGLGGYIIATTQVKYLITLPPASQIMRPLILTAGQNWSSGGSSPFVVIMANGNVFTPGSEGRFLIGSRLSEALIITIVEGSEEYLSSGGGLITSTLTTRTTTTMQAITTTMAIMTAFLTTTITAGLSTNIGAAIDNSRLPPSFPPSSPIMIEYALAKNLRIDSSIPPHYRLIRRKRFAANPPLFFVL